MKTSHNCRAKTKQTVNVGRLYICMSTTCRMRLEVVNKILSKRRRIENSLLLLLRRLVFSPKRKELLISFLQQFYPRRFNIIYYHQAKSKNQSKYLRCNRCFLYTSLIRAFYKKQVYKKHEAQISQKLRNI